MGSQGRQEGARRGEEGGGAVGVRRGTAGRATGWEKGAVGRRKRPDVGQCGGQEMDSSEGLLSGRQKGTD